MMSDMVEVATTLTDFSTGQTRTVKTMEPAPVAVQKIVPQVISRFQARAALMDAGILADVEIAVAGAGPLAQLAWAEAIEWRRDSHTISVISDALGLSDEDLDDLFIAAAGIVA